jgi:catechol 2,3-dioxygenase-like lactoylglutathione lyase family enzyme
MWPHDSSLTWRLLVILVSSLILPYPTPAQAASVVSVQAVTAVGFTVSDMERSIAFYRDVLTFTRVSDVEVDGSAYDTLWGLFGVRARVVRMQLGEQQLELIQFLAPPDARPIPMPSYSHDLWFQHIAVVVRDMDAAWAQVRQHHVRQISPRPQTIPHSNPAAAGIQALKFRDPDGHNLELLHFPDDKGPSRWHRTGGPVFLGIDHTAMTVRSTERSVTFYRDLLGLTVAGGTLNTGVEQERLDSLPGARVRATGLRPPSGPLGIEFLEYERPSAGRVMPSDTSPTDLWHWQVTVTVDDPEAAAQALCPQAACVSQQAVTLPDQSLGFRKGVLLRDPDGHVVQLVAGSP